jgi:hypothetical protein
LQISPGRRPARAISSKPDPILQTRVAQHSEDLLVEQLRQHDRRERLARLIGIALRNLGMVLVIQLEPLADPLRRKSGSCAPITTSVGAETSASLASTSS